MPRFMTIIHIDQDAATAFDGDPEFGERMNALFEEITKAGVMLDTAGLLPAAEGATLTWEHGEVSHTDGPFTETKEVIGGYSVVQAKDKAEAVQWARRFLEVHPAGLKVTAEVRQIAEDDAAPCPADD